MSVTFDQAVAAVANLKERGANSNFIDNDAKLRLYGWYKQATLGDNKERQPSMFAAEARAKWSAWTRCKGIDSLGAQRAYINEVLALGLL